MKSYTEIARTKSFAKNSNLEILLSEVNGDLWPAEEILLQKQESVQYPVILIMGPARCGSTLFMQWLANLGLFAYPTNLLSRFFRAPIIGAKIQQLLTDQRFNFRNELSDLVQSLDYRSENGKTKGVLAPNEFWYFWRRFLAEPGRDVWSDEELKQHMDARTMLGELTGMINVFQKPLAAKGMLFNYNIPFLDAIFEKVIFVHIKRDAKTNTLSVLDARKRQLGSEEFWYSFDIPEKQELMKLKPFDQALGQVNAVNEAVELGLKQVADEKKVVVQYEEFCKSPQKFFELLLDKLKMRHLPYSGPNQFQLTR